MNPIDYDSYSHYWEVANNKSQAFVPTQESEPMWADDVTYNEVVSNRDPWEAVSCCPKEDDVSLCDCDIFKCSGMMHP